MLVGVVKTVSVRRYQLSCKSIVWRRAINILKVESEKSEGKREQQSEA